MLSTVIPVYNEEESLAELHAELSAVARAHDFELDIVFVDDGSTDGSWSEISRLAAQDSRVRGIRFRRNFGKAAALSAGFAAARGDLVMTLDADLQDDPAEIPRFLEAMRRGVTPDGEPLSDGEEPGEPLDVVSGWKQVRHDPWHKVLPSRVFNWLVGQMTGVRLHDHNCGFKCYRRQIFDEVRLYGELHRFVPVLAAARGWKVGEIVVNHRPRQHGHSKYGLSRIVKGFLDLLTVCFLTGYQQRPQHVLGTAGLVCFLLGGLGLFLLMFFWVILRLDNNPENDLNLHQRAVFYYSIVAFLLGGQFMSIGFVAELMTALYGRGETAYSIRERTGRIADRRQEEGEEEGEPSSASSAAASPSIPPRRPPAEPPPMP